MDKQTKHFKDGETRDLRGRWAGKVVTVRKPYYELIEELREKIGMKKAQFWRDAVMLGVVQIARSYDIDFSFPALDELPKQNKNQVSERRFPAWLFHKRSSNGVR
jgi:hypothetical protein